MRVGGISRLSHSNTASGRRDWDRWLIVLSLNVLFLRNALGSVGFNIDINPVYFEIAIYGLLCLAALNRLARRSSGLPGSLLFWLGIGSSVVFLMLLRSTFDIGEVGIRRTIRSSVPWVITLLLPVIGDPETWDDLDQTFKWHAVIGVMVNLLSLSTTWELATSTRPRYLVASPIKSDLGLLYSVPYLLFLYGNLKPFMRIVVVVAMLEHLFMGVASESKGTVIDVGVIILLALWIHWRARREAQTGHDRKFLANVLLIMLVFWGGQWMYSTLSHRIEFLKMSFLLSEGQKSIADNERWDEVGVFFEQLDPLEYIWGRGVEGSFYNRVVPQNPTYIHVGYVQAVLKGGIPLMLLLLLGLAATGIRVLLLSTDSASRAAAGVVTRLAIKLVMGNILTSPPNPTYVISLICFGYCLYWLADRAAHTPATRSTLSAS